MSAKFKITVYEAVAESSPEARFYACIHTPNTKPGPEGVVTFWDRLPVAFFAASREDVEANARAHWDEGIEAQRVSEANRQKAAVRATKKAAAPDFSDEPDEAV